MAVGAGALGAVAAAAGGDGLAVLVRVMMVRGNVHAGFSEDSRFGADFPAVVEGLVGRCWGGGRVVGVGAEDVEEGPEAVAEAAVAFVGVWFGDGGVEGEVAWVPEMSHRPR